MEHNTEKKLTVYMLNDFCVMYGDEALPLEKFGNSKLMELFQIILRYKKTGISRGQLQQMLYDEDSVDDKSHSLDSLVYRLKRTLEQTGLVQNEFHSHMAADISGTTRYKHFLCHNYLFFFSFLGFTYFDPRFIAIPKQKLNLVEVGNGHASKPMEFMNAGSSPNTPSRIGAGATSIGK